MNVRIAFGRDTILVDIPDGWIGNRVLRHPRLEALGDISAALDACFREPLCAPPLSELFQPDRDLCIAVDETARAKPLLAILPPLLQRIEHHVGISPERITLLLTDPASEWSISDSEPSLQSLLDLPGYRVEGHHAEESVECAALATLSSGLPLALNKTWVQAPQRMLLSLVEPRLLWGYGGGRTTVLPGLVGAQSMREYLHDAKRLAHSAALPGVLRDNPFHLLALEALQKAPPPLAVYFFVNREDHPVAIFAGECMQSHLAAVNDYRGRMEVVLPQLMDVVVTGCGGWPQDSTLADAVRSMVSASRILRSEGTLIVAAACERGIGPPAFEKMLRIAQSPKEYFRLSAQGNLSNPYTWLTHQFYSVLSRHEVIFCTEGIEQDDLWSFGLTPAPELAEAVHGAMENYGQDCRIAAIPEGWRTTVRTE